MVASDLPAARVTEDPFLSQEVASHTLFNLNFPNANTTLCTVYLPTKFPGCEELNEPHDFQAKQFLKTEILP